MSDSTKKFDETFEVRLTPGRAGLDPNAPDWELWEVKGDQTETACDNLTLAEANELAAMWSRKRDEAEAEDH